MDKQYRLPLVAMVETMKSSPQCVLLQAQLVSLPSISKQACVAHVIVGQGVVHACRITGATGSVLLEQQKAYEALTRCGDVDWLVLPAPPYAAAAVGQSVTRALGNTSHAGNVPVLRVSPLPRGTLDQIPRGLRIALVVVIGRQIFAIEIYSQLAEASKLDWRQSYKDVRYGVHRLPTALEGTLLQLVCAFDLQYASMDLIITPSGEYVWLELNPNGQFLWLQPETGLPMVGAMAQVLFAPKEYGLWER